MCVHLLYIYIYTYIYTDTGVYMFSYIMGTVSSVVKGLTGEDSAFREKTENVTVFLNTHSVPKDIKMRIRKS